MGDMRGAPIRDPEWAGPGEEEEDVEEVGEVWECGLGMGEGRF